MSPKQAGSLSFAIKSGHRRCSVATVNSSQRRTNPIPQNNGFHSFSYHNTHFYETFPSNLYLATNLNDDGYAISSRFGSQLESQVLNTSPMHNSIQVSDMIQNGATSSGDGVLSTQDIVVGTILALFLAFGYSFLNGQSSSSSFVSWPRPQGQSSGLKEESFVSDPLSNDEEGDANNEEISVNEKVFDADGWKDVSRKENYILYNTRIRRKTASNAVGNKNEKRGVDVEFNQSGGVKSENKTVLIALLALFLPIFFVETFFALSRQFMCEMGDSYFHISWAEKMCSPIWEKVKQ